MKHMAENAIHLDRHVAPFMGAWIETQASAGPAVEILVAPFMGAWIETVKSMI